MSATRLLILSALRFLQPAHGYKVRAELETWRADQWANVAYGSIYHALNAMAAEGLLAVVEPAEAGEGEGEGSPPRRGGGRISYRVTPAGEEEFQRLVREYWWEQKPLVDPFLAAVSVMDQLPRDELLAALRFRAVAARSAAESFRFAAASPSYMQLKPRHVAAQLELMAMRADAEQRWVEGTIAAVERGDLP